MNIIANNGSFLDYFIPQEPALKINLKGLDVQKILNTLTGLLVQYKDWDDNLSIRIHDWGLDVIAFQDSIDKIPRLQLKKAVAEKITELRKTILIDPLTMATFVAPVLEQDTWEWEEEAIYKQFQNHLPSPFTGQLIQEYRSHDFAREIIFWVDTYFPTPSTVPSTPELKRKVTLEQKENLPLANNLGGMIIPVKHQQAFGMMVVFAQEYHTRTGLWQLHRKINEYILKSQQNFRDALALIEKRAQEARLQAQENAKLVNNRIVEIKQTHDNTVGIVNAQLQDAHKKVENAECQIKIGLETVKKQGQEILALRQQFANAQQELESLRNRGSHSTCTIQ